MEPQPAAQGSTPPRLIALVLCDDIDVDPGSGSISLRRLVEVVLMRHPPAPWHGWIYLKAEGVSLSSRVTIRIVRASDGAIVGAVPAAFRHPIMPTVAVFYDRIKVGIQEAGCFWFTVEIDDVEVGRTPLIVPA